MQRHGTRTSRAYVLFGILFFFTTLLNPLSAPAAVRCEWLFNSAEPEVEVGNGRNANPALIPADVTVKQTPTWLRDSFWDILEHFPFYRSVHAARILEADKALRRDGFERGPVEVELVERSTYQAVIRYTNRNPAAQDQAMTIELVAYFFSSDLMKERDGGLVLFEQNFSYRIVGLTTSKTDFKRRERNRAASRNALIENFRRDRKFDSKTSQPWVEHMRRVLRDILVPLSLGDTGIWEVGIGFPPQAQLTADGVSSEPPTLIIGRDGDWRRATPIAQTLLHPGLRPVEMDGVQPIETFVDSHTRLSVRIVDRRDWVVVFDEMLDQNPDGTLYAVNRDTRERRQLYYNPKYDEWTFQKPAASDTAPVPVFNPSKLNQRLAQRVLGLDRGEGNPRVKVQIHRRDSKPTTTILSIRQIRDLSLEPDVMQITEFPF